MRNTNVLVQTPCAALRPVVKRFLVVESTAAHCDAHLPETGLIAAFCFQGNCQLESGDQAPPMALTGLWETLRTHSHSQDHAVVIVSFTAMGAAALLRRPVDEFANATIDLTTILGTATTFDRFSDRLATAINHKARIGLVTDFLLAHVDNVCPDPAIAAAVTLIEQSKAMVRIEEVARQTGLSQSALERRFRRLVGTSPRKFASLARLQNVIQLRNSGADFTTIAHTAGYCDQPHFIKDFKRFRPIHRINYPGTVTNLPGRGQEAVRYR